MSRYCSECGKSRKACICPWIESLSSNVELVILQHTSEQHRPMGTARILSLSLSSCRCWVGEDFSQHTALNALLREPDVDHYVLYPAPDSVSIEALPSTQFTGRRQRVILLDGTWKKAYKMWQLATNLHSLPSIHLPEHLQGEYRIRKAPNENSLSTVEAGYHLLSLLEPQRNFSPLLTPFRKMIDFQIAHMPDGVYQNNYLKQ